MDLSGEGFKAPEVVVGQPVWTLGHQHDMERAQSSSALTDPFHAGAGGVQASGRVGHLANRVTKIFVF